VLGTAEIWLVAGFWAFTAAGRDFLACVDKWYLAFLLFALSCSLKDVHPFTFPSYNLTLWALIIILFLTADLLLF
jgi:hypothetical protein